MIETCGICRLHQDPLSRERYEITRSQLWVLRHHPDPAPLPGWMLLDSLRHCGGPLDFEPPEAETWGLVVRDASQLVQKITGCDRVYAIAFGEGAQHLHLHLIPRFVNHSDTSAWAIADYYRLVASGKIKPVHHEEVRRVVIKSRGIMTLKEYS